MRFAALAGLAALGLASCTEAQMQQMRAGNQPPPASTPASGAAASSYYAPVDFSALPGWTSDNVADALPALLLDCTRDALSPQDLSLGGTGIAAQLGGHAGQWLPACQAARAITPGDSAGVRSFLQSWFTPYELEDNGSAQALLTGYYEPEVDGSRTKHGAYQTPLLARPRDLIQVPLGDFDPSLAGHVISGQISGATLAPYFTRSEIEAGALKPQKLELIYLASPVDAYFLQVQGSGRVKLPDGEIIRVGYAGKNGRPYVPIGKILADRGDIPAGQVSMQTISDWLKTHPDQAQDVMDQNPSYVFFRIITSISADQGPPGEFGVSLTAGRSLAIDRDVVPLGAPMWMATTDPVDGSSVQRLMLAQDTGTGITGPLHADIFYGAGADAASRAGRARQAGTLFVLLPKQR